MDTLEVAGCGSFLSVVPVTIIFYLILFTFIESFGESDWSSVWGVFKDALIFGAFMLLMFLIGAALYLLGAYISWYLVGVIIFAIVSAVIWDEIKTKCYY
jgi:uncharacterized membrane protein YesL